MKKYISEFFRRGLLACGSGPVVLAILYLILRHTDNIEVLTVNQVCIGIFSITLLAFVVGGMNVIYQIERLPLMTAIFIHGLVLYISYLLTYLINGWLETGLTSVLAFSGIFIVGYLIIWIVIYSVTKRSTNKLNRFLKENRESGENI